VNDEDKPRLAVIPGVPTIDDILALFEQLTGKTTPPQERERLAAKWERLRQEQGQALELDRP
jgi:hypothetical protein